MRGAGGDGGFQVAVDATHGGRWTSLLDPDGREWLWHHSNVDRFGVRPGDAFIDAGGVEECFPSITGRPDHGDVWSRPWHVNGEWMTVRTGVFTLSRRIRTGAAVEVDYSLRGPAGAPFTWAFHALLTPDVGTRIITAPTRTRAWPQPGHFVEQRWPRIAGLDGCDMLGPDDQSAIFGVLVDTREVRVEIDGAALNLRIDCPETPAGIGIWRNLRGFPATGSRYRSFGVEPMVGCTPDPDTCHGEAAVLPSSGELAWRLSIS